VLQLNDSHIFDPVKDYSKFKAEHLENVDKLFDELVVKAGTDEEENKQTVNLINKHQKDIDEAAKKLRRIKKFGNFIKLLFILLFIGASILAILLYNGIKADDASYFLNNDLVLHVVVNVFCLIIGIFLVIIKKKKINVKIKNYDEYIQKMKKSMDELIDKAWNQMLSLNISFDWNMPNRLLEKTLKIIKMDSYVDAKKYDLLCNYYGLVDLSYNNEVSTTFIQSGEIFGNPFIIENYRLHYMGSKTYTGSLIVEWYEDQVRSDGTIERVKKTQTLYASVTKPYPEYTHTTRLIYGNDAAPDLTFQREGANVHLLSEKELEKLTRKGMKKIEKKEAKAIKSGDDFTAISNEEFEVLFNALNRNNEIQFRMLFTPLAQRQMLSIIKDKQFGFGDNFSFKKQGKINIITSSHLNSAKVNISPEDFVSYEFAKTKNLFKKYNDEYFDAVYKAFAPILSIPLYQENKTITFDYKENYNSYLSIWEHEAIVNSINISELVHPHSITKNILKTNVYASNNGYDLLQVTAYGYTGVERVDFIPVRANNGNFYNVPVKWIQYIPVEKTSNVLIKKADNLTREAFLKQVYGNNQWKDFFTRFVGSLDNLSYRKNLLVMILKNDLSQSDLTEINKFVNEGEV